MAAGLKTYNLCAYLILSLTACSVMASSSSSQSIKGAYWPSWAKNFPPSSIETSFFTHIYYAFLIPNNVTFKFDIEYATEVELVNFTSTLHAKKPPVKTLFSIGGADEGPVFFGRMASSPSLRKNFVDSSIEVARKFGFDGIDLDWEFPQTPKDMENLAYLLDEWRLEVQKEAKISNQPPLLLTAAVYFSANFFLSGTYRSYPATSITKNLDWINVMNYDYHGSWDTSTTGAQAALFDSKTNISTSYGLGSWIKSGVPKSKLVMGLPLYGRTWKLKDPKSHAVGAPAIDVGPGDQGALTFAEIVKFNRDHKAKVEYDAESVSMYSVADTTWIGYDDTPSVTVKIGYALALRIRGYFFWAVNGDYKWKISKTASQLWRL
ncbi:acidic mammalian chitinase-like [Olea europaea subsp. europaea]|uniref:Acidic mammalian chitinase-like n=1 Tax=Olea europaea subsp. europaea TaxID=158383 RepID=A0A8S0RZ20_OLEEU|nr:acidic mammalian chitinase-like [Olea europaea subsp. europaea]